METRSRFESSFPSNFSRLSVPCLATIDLGTNTVRLLVVEVTDRSHWRVLQQDQAITRLGEGLTRNGVLSEIAIARTVFQVTAFCQRAEQLGANEILLVATSAVREAQNQATILQEIHAATGRTARVISGEEEARLTFLGARIGLAVPTGHWALIDIGGGSTEFILAEQDTIRTAISLQLGVVPLTEALVRADPVDWTEYATLSAHIETRLAREISQDFFAGPLSGMIGTAGTVTALAALDQGLEAYLPERVQGYQLRRHRVEKLLAFLGSLRLDARAHLPCLEPGRADLIIPGIAICVATMKLFNLEYLTVSDYGLREGVLVERLRAL